MIPHLSDVLADAPFELHAQVAGVGVRLLCNTPRLFDELSRHYRPGRLPAGTVPTTVVARHGKPLPTLPRGTPAKLLRGTYEETEAPFEGRLFREVGAKVTAMALPGTCLVAGDLHRASSRICDFVDLMVTEQLVSLGYQLSSAQGVSRDGIGIVLAGPRETLPDVVAARLMEAGYAALGGHPLLLGLGPEGARMVGSTGDLHLSAAAVLSSARLSRHCTTEQLGRYARLPRATLERPVERVGLSPGDPRAVGLRVAEHAVHLVILFRWRSDLRKEMNLRPATPRERELMLQPFDGVPESLAPTTMVAEGQMDVTALCQSLQLAFNEVHVSPATAS
ncbi:MAG: hypothetical protein IT371_24695 [Deltaproteobacteria bacterium]|nr:hypothetical protein [Deltaproteobacteria bacterium]